jgi:fused signal recognition particle receptor
VLLCAADTFRAAAVEQLAEWSTRAAVDIVIPLDSEEWPESVAARACEKALAEQYDIVIVDTSGRLSNNRKLNEELRGMKKAIKEKV